MKQIINSIFLAVIVISGCSKSDSDILQKTNKKLQKITSVYHQTEIENYNPMTGELGISKSAKAYLQFASNDTVIGCDYHFSDDYGKFGYKNSLSFCTNREKKNLIYNEVKTYDDLAGIYGFAYPISTLRRLLPKMLNDSSIVFTQQNDTIINNENCYHFHIIMHDKQISLNQKLVEKNNVTRTFSLMVGKKDFLPKQFVVFFEKENPLWVVSYNNYKFPKTVHDSLFDYTLGYKSYLKFSQEEYLVASRNNANQKDETYLNKQAPDWTLPLISGDSIKLSEINASIVMLEFWFPYCTGCVAAIPEINDIQKIYKNKGLKIFGVEFTKQDSTGLEKYIKTTKMEYPTFYNAKDVAIKYGVSAGPTIFLINNKGKFIYSRTGFFKEEIIKTIEENLKFSP